MIDPMLSLAFTIHANPGVYALMLGSGISRTSGIPTGWDIVLEFIHKLATLQKEKCEPDAETWFRTKYSVEPNYSKLLNELAKTPAERKNLLRPYFEPNDDEREQGLKLPSPAHRAIAELMAQGYFRVVLTTNFDRLIEEALQTAGITPYVVSHSSDIEGAPPLSQGGCIVVKLHGDYLDTRILNTPEELEQYQDSQSDLLDRIIDEFGLIVCGWSAEWDIALRDGITRCKSRRYSTYWASKGKPSHEAQKLIDQRKGEIIGIEGADTFFRELADKVTSLHEIDQPHPLTAKVAVASEKRFLAAPHHHIRLHDLIHNETERAVILLSDVNFTSQSTQPTQATVEPILRDYRARTEILLSVLATGCYWGIGEHQKLWVDSLQRIANLHNVPYGIPGWLWGRDYPSLLLQYASGIGALASNKYATLEAILTQPRYYRRQDKLIETLEPNSVLPGLGKASVAQKKMYVPVSEHLFTVLRETFADLVPDDQLYNELFDRFEYVRSIYFAFTVSEQQQTATAIIRKGPLGRFGYREQRLSEHSVQQTIEYEAQSGEFGSFLVVSPTFQSSMNFLKVKEEFDAFVQSVTWSW